MLFLSKFKKRIFNYRSPWSPNKEDVNTKVVEVVVIGTINYCTCGD